MEDQAAKDTAAKERIIKHLNADHQRSLSYYLQHYANVSARTARAPTITDISFSAMTLRTTDGKTHSIPFNPPMKSWSEARTRTVEMDREARAALDISDIRITEYEPPADVLQMAILGICLFTFTMFATRKEIVPGTWFYDNVLPWYPGGPEWFLWIVKNITFPVVAIHVGEAWYLEKSRLRKHGVEKGSALWWKWISSCFIEGRGTFRRIDRTVKSKRAEADKAKH